MHQATHEQLILQTFTGIDATVYNFKIVYELPQTLVIKCIWLLSAYQLLGAYVILV